MTIEFPTQQDAKRLSKAYPDVVYPFIDLVRAQHFDMAHDGDYCVIVTNEADGLYTYEGSLARGWDLNSKSVFATPHLSGAGVVGDVSIAATGNESWIATYSFGLNTEPYPDGFYYVKGSGATIPIGSQRGVVAYSPRHSAGNLFYLKADGLYSRNSADSYSTEELEWAINGVDEFEIYLGKNFRTQVKFFGGGYS